MLENKIIFYLNILKTCSNKRFVFLTGALLSGLHYGHYISAKSLLMSVILCFVSSRIGLFFRNMLFL